MEKIEPMVKYYIQILSEDVLRWISWDGVAHDTYETAKLSKDKAARKMHGYKFHVVRATTTYEVMEETK